MYYYFLIFVLLSIQTAVNLLPLPHPIFMPPPTLRSPDPQPTIAYLGHLASLISRVQAELFGFPSKPPSSDFFSVANGLAFTQHLRPWSCHVLDSNLSFFFPGQSGHLVGSTFCDAPAVSFPPALLLSIALVHWPELCCPRARSRHDQSCTCHLPWQSRVTATVTATGNDEKMCPLTLQSKVC